MKRLFKIGNERHDVGRVTFSWHPDGNFIASAGRNGIIHITDRHGDIIDEIPLSTSAPVLQLEWDRDGEYLAVLQEGNGVVPLWNLSSKRIVPLETNLKDPSFLAWSRTGPQLAIGTQKGNLLIYNKSRKQKIPIVGKHSKRIICGGWSLTGNKLVLASDDKTLTISNDNGDTLLQTDLRHVALEAKFTLTEKYSVMNNNNDNGNKGGSNSRNESKTSSSYDRNNGGGSKDDVLISANLNGKSLLLYNIMDEKEDPLELTFAPKDNGNGCRYGDLMKHTWYSDDTVLVGFSDGYLLSVSTSPKQLGEEQYCNHIHNHELISFSYNPILKRVATAGDDGVKIIDIHNFKEIKSDMITLDEIENSDIDSIGWSPDGQILTVSTVKGNIYNFLAKMSVLFANYKTSIAYLSSLREISIVDGVKKSRPIDVIVKLEPTLIAVGGKHVAAGMNNRVYYHRISNGADENTPPINEQEYIGIVREILLNNDYAVILTDSKAMIHPIEPSKDSNNQTKSFPNREEGSYSKVTCIALTDNFFFYGTEAGTVEIFFLSEWTLLSGIELRLENSIKKIYPNPYGTRIVVIDGANQVFLYNPVNGTGGAATNKAVTRFESTPAVIVNVLWDLEEKNIILLYDNNNCIHTYIYVQTSIEGSKLLKLGPVAVSGIGEISMKPDKVEILPGNTPVISCGGVLTCQAQSGNISSIIHPFFDRLDTSNRKKKASSTSSKRGGVDDADRQEYELKSNYFCQCLALHKLEKAWELAVELDKKSFFLALSHKAMELLQIELATRIYVQLGDAGMVMALKQCELIEDKHLLAGQILLLFGDYQRAQDLFLSSSRPLTALEMRKDLIQWDQALKLAQILSPIQIPDICISYGQQLEARNEIDLSLKMYEEALHALDNDGNRVISDALIPTAMMGITRCQLRLGNVRQGIRQANELDDIQLFIECGTILENAKQYSEAASMYIKGKQYEKAALIYTKYLIKNDKNRINEMLLIIDKVNNDAINSAFGKACLSVQRYEDALNAYMRCNEIDKVVEILLKYLDSTQKAFDIVRKSPSSNASQIIADYCLSHQDYRGAIEFLLLANKLEDAFKLAQQQNIMDIYTSFFTDAIGNKDDNTKEGEGANAANNKSLLLLMPSEDAIKVAQYYEKQQKYGLSGKYYAYSGQYAKALKLFLQCGDREIDSAIDIVGKSQNETLTHQLIDFLVGEKDGLPKDPKYIYRLYLALKKYEDAAKTALIIARQEQELGQYLTAHKVICETIRHLEDASIKVNLQLRENFILLHSYERAKGYVIKQDHINAARLLLRISQHISKFPLHKVKILTLTVIECSRAGLKTAAYEHAVTLVRPEYRSLLDNNFKKQIEGIVRKKSILRDGNYEEPPETTSPCPISGLMIPVYQLECPTTRDALPMCIISGKHMVLDDWCFCPVSKFPALYSEYVRYIRETTKKLDSASRDASESKVDSNSSGYTPSSGKMNEPQTDEGDEGNGNLSNALVSATDMYLSAPDPILGKSVSVNDLILCTKEDATKYIQRYNNVFEKKKEDSNNNQKDDKDNKEDQKDGSSSPTKKEGNNEDEDEMVYSPVKSKKDGSSGTSKGKTGGVNPMNNKDGKVSKAKLDRIQRQRRRRNGGDKR